MNYEEYFETHGGIGMNIPSVSDIILAGTNSGDIITTVIFTTVMGTHFFVSSRMSY